MKQIKAIDEDNVNKLLNYNNLDILEFVIIHSTVWNTDTWIYTMLFISFSQIIFSKLAKNMNYYIQTLGLILHNIKTICNYIFL